MEQPAEEETFVPSLPFDEILSLRQDFAQQQAQGAAPAIADYLERVEEDARPSLLRNLIDLEVQSRRANGEQLEVDDYLTKFPSYAAVIREAVADATSRSSLHSQETADFQVVPVANAITGRLGSYRLVGELGRGGMGVVYEAIHIQTANRVALKTLPTLDGKALHRFKREFRAIASINHPNLIGLQQLEADGQQWYFTMDLVDGVSFLDYVRPDGFLDEGRLRGALTQLVAAVLALHAQHIIHRDLKPSNVLVTSDGSVVVLDFGLVIELDALESLSRNMAGLAGTPLYMAPEQAAGIKVTAACDWYAVGVMLYEALSGKTPFSGNLRKLLLDKQDRDPPPLSSPTIPDDLNQLCMQLLTRDPAQRPNAREIVKQIASTAPVSTSSRVAQLLVGRELQLSALRDAHQTLLRSGRPVTVFASGRSGEGKTALAEHFLSSIRGDRRNAVMAGRCYDRESVPFKALDTLVDALATFLMSLPGEDAALLIPDDVGMLVRVFPVLQRVSVVSRAADLRIADIDDTQIRQRAFRALRSLLGRLSRRQPIIWFVDDLQWGDADSAEALFEILRPPEAPLVLFLGTYRSDEIDESVFLAKWKDLQQRHGVDFADREVAVGPLSETDCVDVVLGLIGRDTPMIRERAREFAQETRGNAFLLNELAACFDPEADSFETIPLDEVLVRKLKRLPVDAEPLLNVIAVSGQALALAEATRAAGHENPPIATLTRMRNERLVRLIGSDENPVIDTYHDRVRESVLERMDQQQRCSLHRALGELIERDCGASATEILAGLSQGVADADRSAIPRVYDLAYHFDAAGERDKALSYGLAGAEQASRQSALEVAVNNYDIARRNSGSGDREIQYRVAIGNAVVLTRLGRYAPASEELAVCLRLFDDPLKNARIEALQGDIANKKGNLQEAVDCYLTGLRRLGWWVPKTSIGFAFGMMVQILVQAWHTVWPGRLYRQSPTAQTQLAVTLFQGATHPMAFMNSFRMIWTQLSSMNLAERYPASPQLSATYSFHSVLAAMVGWPSRSMRYGDRATELARQFDDDWSLGLAHSYRGIGYFAGAQFAEAIPAFERAIAAFEKAGDLWEVHIARFHKACCHYGLGDLSAAVNESRAVYDSSARLGDSRVLCSSYLWSRATRGQLPFDSLRVCYPHHPDDVMSTAHGIMAEGHWHSFHGRTAEALKSFEQAFALIWSGCCWNFHTVVVIPKLAGAQRRHADTVATTNPNEASRLRRRANRTAKWGARLMVLFPAHRPLALRERALILDALGKTNKALAVATKSCDVAQAQNAKYEYAQSLRVRAKLARSLNLPEADEQSHLAETALNEIEQSLQRTLEGQT